MRSSEHKQWYKVEGGWTVSQKLQRHDFSLTPILDSSQTRISASSRHQLKLCKRPRLTRGYTDKPKSNPRTHSEYKRSWNKITKRVKKRFKFEAPRPPRAGTTTKKNQKQKLYSPVVPAGVISLKCSTTSSLPECLASLAKH